MAAATAAGAVEPAPGSSRFASLLQPIKDLSKVWRIPIAEDLEKYLEELEQFSFLAPEGMGGSGNLNFAEAALLIQGSTAIYSRKVELLYALVYQALDLLACDKSKVEALKKGKAVQTGLWSPIPESDELITIDHLIKEGRNTLLDQSGMCQRDVRNRRVPLFLMPRSRDDRHKSEFRISNCTIHSSGAYILQESDSRLLEKIMTTIGSSQPSDALVPAPPQVVPELDQRLQDLSRELPNEYPQVSPSSELGNFDPQSVAKTVKKTPSQVTASTEAKIVPLTADPWALLDEHETVGIDVPLEVGKTCGKKINVKRLLTNANGLPDSRGAGRLLTDDEMWNSDVSSCLASVLTAGNPVESLFLSVAGHLKPGSRCETQKASFSAAWLEFEDLFSAAIAKRRHLKALRKAESRKSGGADTPPRYALRGEGSDVDDSGDEKEQTERMAGVRDNGTEMSSTWHDGFAGELDTGQLSEEMRRQKGAEKAQIVRLIEDAKSEYEQKVRDRLHKEQQEQLVGNDPNMPGLYARIQQWKEHLEIVLKEQHARPKFDVEHYSDKLLVKLSKIHDAHEEVSEEAVPFARIVANQPRWEVCRRFMTTLFLTNHGNTDIVLDNDEETTNRFGVKLLQAERKWVELEQRELLELEEEDAALNLEPPAPESTLAARHGKALEDARDSPEPPAKRRRISVGRPPATPSSEMRRSNGGA
eukprot:gnl/TRDRNA2_/TRDRNA2_189519_c0_seq1.p1 gnl/TRDRNA2_/TRDRNA2_189519_c0~~gnl/TRDRNA2_/TRDRNA2_189519_c0_seq1.p1  ORF type:complete len:719 (+),score=164.01 gnl/TRDRNA2_/TRDRNA2_189519_c0_seq1:51-2159(+)